MTILGRIFRHKKRGTTYAVIGVGRAQGAISDDDPVVLYRGEDGSLWVRHQAEFCDGRFEAAGWRCPHGWADSDDCPDCRH